MKTIHDLLLVISNTEKTPLDLEKTEYDQAYNIKILKKNRRTGKTTRLVNEVIQFLFKNKKLELGYRYTTKSDFYDPNSHLDISVQRLLVNKVIKRLELEHFGCFSAIITPVNCIITII